MRSFELVREEVARLFRKPIMIIAVAVMTVIPLLYGALYLWAFWDPYGALDRIPIALVNLDRAAQADGEPITAGSDLVEQLLEKRVFDWRVVSAEEADRGVREGTYYGSLIIPRDFSSALAKADSDSPSRARLRVVLHESRNMIAAQIEGKVFGEVRKAASTSASKGYFDSVFLGFDEIREGLDDAAEGSEELADGLESAADGSRVLAAGAHQARDGGAELAEGMGKLGAGASTLASGTANAADGARALAAGAATLSGGASSLSSGASRLATGATALAGGLGELERGTTSLSVSAAALADGVGEVDAGITDIGTGLQTASAGAGELRIGASGVTQLLVAIAAKYPDVAADPLLQNATATAAAVASGTATLAESLNGAGAHLTVLASGAHQAAAGSRLLASGAASVSSATAQAHTGAAELALGATQLASGGAEVDAGTARLAAGASEAATGFARLADGSDTLAGKVSEAASGATALAEGLDDLRDGTADLADGLDDARKGSGELAEGVASGADDVPHYTETGRAARAEMMSDPVALDEAKLGKVSTYGTGFAPYFIPLALWVGMLIVFMLLAAVPETAARSGASSPVVAMTGMWPAIIIGLGQSVLLYAVLHFGLGLAPANPLATFGIIVLTAVVYAAIMQWLSAAFGPVGKLMGMVVLMLQLTSAAGTFPLETLPGFFRTISPFMPMTHAVAALRESVSGADAVVMAHEAWILALFGVAAFAGTAFSVRDVGSWSSKRLKPTIEL